MGKFIKGHNQAVYLVVVGETHAPEVWVRIPALVNRWIVVICYCW